MNFQKSTFTDIETIFALYDAAIEYQKIVSPQHWQQFDRELVAREIAEGRQWKIVEDDQIACVFVTTETDAAIWGDRDAVPSIYLHRIVTNPTFRGRNYVQKIIWWAQKHGKINGKKCVRLDTWGDNLKLKSLYEACGFTFLGVGLPADISQLPAHYSTISLAFFEMEIAPQ